MKHNMKDNMKDSMKDNMKNSMKDNMKDNMKYMKRIMELKQILLLCFVLLNRFTKVKAVVNGTVVDPPGKYPFIVNGGTCSAVLVSPNAVVGVGDCCYKKLKIGAHNLTDRLLHSSRLDC